MGLPYVINSELSAIHQEKLTLDGVDPTEEERVVIIEQRAEQFGLILGKNLQKKLHTSGVDDVHKIKKIIGVLMGMTPDDGTVATLEDVIGEVLIETRAEFREFIGL
jgi:hypothetical protein